MKKINKSILLILVVLLFILFMPCSIKAEDEPLGSADPSITLIIMYARNNETDDKEGIVLYTYKNSSIEIKNAKDEEIQNPIAGLTVFFDESSNSFIVTLDESADINLEAYFTNGFYNSIINCPCNLKIVGNGSLTFTALSLPEAFRDSYTGITSYISAKGNIDVGDETTYPSIKFLADLKLNDEHPYDELDGFVGDKFYIQNSNIYGELNSFIFNNIPLEEISFESSQAAIGNMLLIDNSTVKAKYIKLNENDVPILCGIIYVQPQHNSPNPDTFREGNVKIINNSVVEYSCDTENLIIDEPYAINLYGESSIIVEDSKVTFNSNSKLNFCNALKMLIISRDLNTFCSSVTCKQEKETNHPLMKLNILEIFDSKYKFIASKGPIFDLKDESIIEEGRMNFVSESSPLGANQQTYPRVDLPENVNSYIYIIERDENIESTITIESGDIFPYMTPSPARQSLFRNAPTRTSLSKYDWIHVESCGKVYPIKNDGNRSEYLDPDIEKDGKLFHIFDFNAYEDLDDKLKASKYFNIVKEQSNNSDNKQSKHEVLNTGVY